MTVVHRRIGDEVCSGLVELDHIGALEAGALEDTVVAEVATGGHAKAVDHAQAGREGLCRSRIRRKVTLDVPVGRATERHPLALALDHDARRDGLHTASREALTHLAPQHRRDLVPIEAVEDAARLLSVHQPGVQLAGLVDSTDDRLFGDLVEHHATDRHLGLEHLEQVPGDGLPLAVLISGQQELVGVLEQTLQLGHLLALAGVDDVVRVEPVVHVDGEPAVRTLLHVSRKLTGVGQITDVSHAGVDVIALAQEVADLLGLGRRLDDDQLASGGLLYSGGAHVVFPTSHHHVQRIRRCSDMALRIDGNAYCPVRSNPSAAEARWNTPIERWITPDELGKMKCS